MNQVTVEPSGLDTIDLTPCIGTEVKIDVETLLSGRYAKKIRQLLAERGVLVFRELNLTDEQQTALTHTLGQPLLQGGQEVMSVSLDTKVNQRLAEYLKGSLLWHADMMGYETPNFASLLTARKLSDVGGETEFANTYAAWDALPEEDKREYEGLKIMHALEASQFMVKPEASVAELEEWRQSPRRVQPLVWTHKTGRKSLVIGATAYFVVGKDREESDYILTKLRDWATQPQFVFQHKWTVGDLVMWDNTGTMHRALPYALDSGRLMRRTALHGEEPVA